MNNSEVSPPATFICSYFASSVEHENPDSNPQLELSLERRKSVENLLISSHEVIGSSISPSLAFSAMTLPPGVPTSHAQTNLQAHPGLNPGMHSLEPRSSSPSSSASPQSSPRPHHKRESSRGGSAEPQGRESSFSRVESATLFISQTYDSSLQEHPSGRSSESSNPPVTSEVWISTGRLSLEVGGGGSAASSAGGSSGVGGGSSSSSGTGGNTWYLSSSKEKKDSSVERAEKGGSKGSSGGEGAGGSSTGGGGSFDKAKKSSWYNALYPTYKTRSEDFKRIFKDLPPEERLIVDYSSALQKDILVHGRIYVSQNYLSFYANIFRWETSVSLRWKEVTSITKEKTALVIPNAIQVCTESGERHFFTSFGARDKTYLMLFRVWQNALMEERMSMQEMWQWVHTCYGDELGLTSDDEEGYVAPPTTDDDKMSAISVKFSVDSLSEDYMNVSDHPLGDEKEMKLLGSEERGILDGEVDESQPHIGNDQEDGMGGNVEGCTSTVGVAACQEGTANEEFPKDRINSGPFLSSQEGIILLEQQTEGIPQLGSPTLLQPPPQDHLPSDMSDTTESEAERNIRDAQDERSGKSCCCSSPHEGRQLVNVILPIHVDQLFTLLFTTSKFYLDFHAERRTCDILQSPWQIDPETGHKVRQVSLTLSLSQSMGPKTAQVTENMVMLPCSRPGFLYSIDVEAHNSGIPYADSFYCFTHFCLSRTSPDVHLSHNTEAQHPITPICSPSGTPSPPPASSTPIRGSPQHLTNLSPSPSHLTPRSPRHHHHHVAGHPSACILSIFTQIKYKKSVWGLVKSIIEKNSWSGLEEFYQSLVSALQLECEKMLSRGGLAIVRSGSPSINIPGGGKRKARLRRRRHGMIGPGLGAAGVGAVGAAMGSKIGVGEDDGLVTGGNVGSDGGLGMVGPGGLSQQHLLHHGGKRGSGEEGGHHAPEVLSCVALLVLVFLLLLNALLYYKLWSLEEWTHQSNAHAFSMLDLHVLRHPPKSHDEWLRLLQQQEALHHVELEKWQRILQAAIQLLRQTEESLTDLLRNIHPVINQRIMAATDSKPFHSPPKEPPLRKDDQPPEKSEWNVWKSNQQVPSSSDDLRKEVPIPENNLNEPKDEL